MKRFTPLLVLLLTACGGGGSDSTPIITVPSFTPAPTAPVTPPIVVAGPALSFGITVGSIVLRRL